MAKIGGGLPPRVGTPPAGPSRTSTPQNRDRWGSAGSEDPQAQPPPQKAVVGSVSLELPPRPAPSSASPLPPVCGQRQPPPPLPPQAEEQQQPVLGSRGLVATQMMPSAPRRPPPAAAAAIDPDDEDLSPLVRPAPRVTTFAPVKDSGAGDVALAGQGKDLSPEALEALKRLVGWLAYALWALDALVLLFSIVQIALLSSWNAFAVLFSVLSMASAITNAVALWFRNKTILGVSLLAYVCTFAATALLLAICDSKIGACRADVTVDRNCPGLLSKRGGVVAVVAINVALHIAALLVGFFERKRLFLLHKNEKKVVLSAGATSPQDTPGGEGSFVVAQAPAAPPPSTSNKYAHYQGNQESTFQQPQPPPSGHKQSSKKKVPEGWALPENKKGAGMIVTRD